MKSASSARSLGTAVALAAILGAAPALIHASQTDLAQAPLATAPTVTVLPNLMYILDDSGSMSSQHMPDEVGDSSSTSCKKCDAAAGSCNVAGLRCDDGYPPYYGAAFNTIYYNPQITYKPGVNSLGASLGNMSPTAAKSDAYDSGSGTKNLTTSWPDVVWCNVSAPTSAQKTDSNVCKKNGVNTDNPFTYNILTTAGNATSPFKGGLPATNGTAATAFIFPINVTGAPYYYDITPREHCTDATLARCTLSATPVTISGTVFGTPAPVRWCKLTADAASTSAVSDTPPATPKCQSKVSSTYKFPRLGTFKRTNIVSTTPTYGSRPGRTDCAAKPNCTYAEELQNFANWYSYYRTRMLLMKTATGHAFTTLDERYRVGFTTINFPDDTTRYVKIDKFTPAQKSAWYDKLYSISSLSGTPLRRALSRVGRHYAGLTDGVNTGMPDDPVQYSCQQNFALLTTDGYWNSEGGVQLDGATAVGNQDNVVNTVAPFYVTRATGTFDGNLSGSGDSLADVAMYYYKNDLRTSGLVSKNNVPTSPKDTATHQHMVTFTLGLGLDGLMTYRPDYETAATGDFAKIKAGNPSGCPWTTGTCDWPVAQGGSPSALDDLWHAAVNGRGTYFSAKDPNSLQSGLTGALSAIQIVTGSAASSATSTPNITPTDNFIYSSTYRTVKWDGEIVAEKIDTATGEVIPGAVWSAGALLDARVAASSDTRTIYTFTTLFANNRKDFAYSTMSAAQKAHFDNKCAALPQCPPLPAAQQALANSGDNLIKWLRGQTGNEGAIYRDREHVLGDTVNAKPAFVGKPNLSYGDAVSPNYASFKAGPAGSRQNVLYIAANDGMLHAFNADTGAELWAWVPRMVWPELHKLAASNYDIAHRYYVDGSPTTMDVFFNGAWRTILVGGLNSGGRGYYALDITDPTSPKGLWEFCADPTGTRECTEKSDDLGYSYGQPIITKWDKTGQWVVIVSSGYNNVSPGDGKGYLYVLDAETGNLLDKKDTGAGDTTTPSGFAKIAGFATNFAVDNTTTFVYGGDLLGNMWRFEMKNMKVDRIAQLKDGSSPPKPQSVTTRPEITEFDAGFRVVYVGTGRLLGSTDLQDPATLTPPENFAYQQTVYGFKDTGADLGNLRATGNLVQQTLTVIDSITRSVSNNPVDWSTKNGWYVDLNPLNDSPGERVNIDTQLVKGALVVVSNEPNSEPCSTGGDAFLYQFDYQSGSFIASAPGQVVGVKLGAALAAGYVVYRLPGGQLKYTEIDVAGKKQTGGINPGGGGAIGKRMSWRELIL